MDFEENKDQSHTNNVAKNRRTLVLLFVMFITPVALAYAAYFGNWFSGSGGAQGELIGSEQVVDIEDYKIIKNNGEQYTGKEFETLYWWIVPILDETCDQACATLNLYTVNQTYLGLGKEASRINELAVLETGNDFDTGEFPKGYSDFGIKGLKPIENTPSGKNKELPANFIYLVDPLGNIFMKYPFIESKDDAPNLSRKLRKDILHLFKYSRLG